MSERVEPPAEHRGVRWHWLAHDVWAREPWEWSDGRWVRQGSWFSLRDAAKNGWRYLAPAIPPDAAP